MNRGTQFEPEARAAAEVQFGMFIEPKVYALGNYLVSLDGIASEGTILEIKVPASAESDLWKAALRGEIPERYQYQLCQQIAVSGSAEDAYLYVYLPEEQKGISIRYRYSPAMWDEVRHCWDQFWSEYMGDTVASDPERTDEEWCEAVDEYRQILEEVNVATSKLETRKARLIELAGEESAKGYGLRLTKVEKAGSIKYAEFVKTLNVKPDDLEPYRGKGSISYTVSLGK
jgi:predicted phage-related endonuclease